MAKKRSRKKQASKLPVENISGNTYLLRISQYRNVRGGKKHEPRVTKSKDKSGNIHTRNSDIGTKKIRTIYVYADSEAELQKKSKSIFNRFRKSKFTSISGGIQVIEGTLTKRQKKSGTIPQGTEISRAVRLLELRKKEKSLATKFFNQLTQALNSLDDIIDEELWYDPTESAKKTLEIRKALDRVLGKRKGKYKSKPKIKRKKRKR